MNIQNTSLYKEFLAQREEILKHKWYESEKAGQDVGFGRALVNWTLNFKTKWIKDRRLQKQQTLQEGLEGRCDE